ncbi:hypothetical protein PINS_up013035 [Pythium insidiosum]|nr:hypothetical protein PINS_up013035 [Pythium insidiosum]
MNRVGSPNAAHGRPSTSSPMTPRTPRADGNVRRQAFDSIASDLATRDRFDGDGAMAGSELQQNEFGGILVTPEQIRAAFEFLDIDKKNRVTAENLRARLSIFYDQLGTRDLKLLLNDQTELTEDYLNTLLLTNEVKQFDPVAEAFKAYDPEETGVISREMLRYVFERLGFGALTEEDIDILIACADHDGDGQINLDDFRHLLN